MDYVAGPSLTFRVMIGIYSIAARLKAGMNPSTPNF